MSEVMPLLCQARIGTQTLCGQLARHYVIHRDWLPQYPTLGAFYCTEHVERYRNANMQTSVDMWVITPHHQKESN